MNKEDIMFREFERKLNELSSLKELRLLKKNFEKYFKNFNIYYKGIELLEKKEIEIKIKKTKNDILKFKLNGLFNLLFDNNKIYNLSSTKDNIINDILKFKSLNFLKVRDLNLEEKRSLNKRYKFLTLKLDCKVNFTKLYRIKKGLYILKTVEVDNIKVTVFYYKNSDFKSIFNKKGSTNLNFTKSVGNPSDFNFSSLDAFKHLEKGDNIRFYGYCNRMGLDKQNRDLLRSIKKIEGGKTFSTYLEDLESSINELKDLLQINPYDIELKDLLWKKEKELRFLTEENNSDVRKTTIEDYY